jgi:alpha-beta hydrolase superfamily lysophospholipase
MNLEFLTVLSTDSLELPALLYSPKVSAQKVAVYLHGNGDSGVFYKEKHINELGKALSAQGIALLALNNRGARYKKSLIISGTNKPGSEEKFSGGAHYELIKDCNKDIDGAVALLKSRNFKEFYLVGFSTGANKICVYDATTKQNPFAKYVHAGPGDDSGLFYNEIGDKKFWLSLKLAKKYIGDDQPLKVMPRYSGMHPFSAQSTYDILDPDGAYNTFPYFESTRKRLGKKKLFDEYKRITKPMLVVYGEYDEFTYTGGGTKKALDLLKRITHEKALERSDFQIIKGTDHGFHGKEIEMAELVASWLSK